MTAAGARTNAYTTDDYTNYHATFAKEDLETILELEADRFQNLAYRGAGVQDRGARGARRVQQEQRRARSGSSSRSSASTRSPRTPTSTPRWASSRTSRTCPTSSSTRRTFFDRWYRPENTTIIVAGDVDAGAGAPAGREVLGRLEAGQLHGRRSRRSRAPTGPGLRARAVDGADAAVGDGRLPRPRVLARRRRTSPPSTCSPTSPSARPPTSTSGWWSDEQKVDQLFPYVPANADPYLVTVFARVKKPEDALYVRDAILRHLRRDARASRCPPSGVDGREVERALRPHPHASTTPSAIAATLARFVRYRALLRHAQQLLPRLRHAHARRTCRRRRGSTSPTRASWSRRCRRTRCRPAIDERAGARQPRAAPPPAARRRPKVIQVPSALPQVRRQAALPRRLRPRSDGQGRAGRAGRGDDRRGRLARARASTRSARRCSRWRAASTRRSTRR